ncbi:MAG: DUF541 domain-containing protein [Thaumarchaeota archaeon]|nr:DUF541 domain-containing protein [Nitrososphaerota archaeon]
MSNVQKRKKTYALVVAVSIGILAVSMIGGFWTAQNTSVVPTANGKTSNDFITKQMAGTSTFLKNEEQNDTSQLFVTGTASKKISPDKVSVTLGVETQKKTAQEAAKNNSEIMNVVINGLKELGLSTNQISTSYYNIHPVYEYYKDRLQPVKNQVLVGYRTTNTITVTISTSENIGEVVDTAINAGAIRASGINYFISEEVQSQVNNELIEQAVLDATMKAEKALAPLNMQIVGVKDINLHDVFHPVFGYDKAVLAERTSAPTPILPSEQQTSVSVSVIFMIG